MRQLLPTPADGRSALEALDDPPEAPGRPAVRVVMLQSLDGAVTLDGRSGPLGGAADHTWFVANRSLADVVLVGAGTARAEGYGPARLTPGLIAERERRGQSRLPPIALVSRSLHLDSDAPFFTGAEHRPIVVTTATSPADRQAALRERADILIAGHDSVEIATAIRAFGDDGARLVVCEGGPTLNRALFAAGLVDELCLTIAPLVTGGGPGIIPPGLPDLPAAFTIHRMFEQDGFLFLRLRPARTGPNPDAPPPRTPWRT